MKRALFILILLMSLTITTRAQTVVTGGLKAGGTLSSFLGKQATNYKSHFGFHAGLFANIGFTDRLAFQPEVLYSQKGGEVPALDLTTKVNYLEVPLLLHARAGEVFFEGGPQIGLLLGAKDQSDTYSRNVKGLYKVVDVGYVFGLGYQVKSGPGLGVRYSGGISKAEKPLTILGVRKQNDIRNSAVQLYLTYSFKAR
ncbi:PorT family protein [Hymenobacter sp. BT175]|uniref:porin family protein n=1 Tax=Hymenobacter translucens TaxID=2886507 RepID=UPI001D0F1D1B|nr:porin family protein [Hymenobacter translucens]MCC2546181.1 PorT family protein [Hymenobacter translucens]